ncbi:MAG: hypothetical protein KAX65_09835 [Caldilineaceae bacterium]|nr:hypothetical protein [Caldilineaceae bacterium]
MIGKFHVSNDLMALAESMGGGMETWAMLEWCCEFEEKNGRGATMRDFMTQKPPLVYRGIYEDQLGMATITE